VCDAHGVLAAFDHHAVGAQRDHLARRHVGPLLDQHRPRAEQLDLLPPQHGERARPRVVRPHRARHVLRRPRPVEARVLALGLGRVRGPRVVLRRLGQGARLEQRERLDQRERAELAQPRPQLAVRLVVGDRRLVHVQHRAGVERRDHAHDRHAGRREPLQDRRADRVGAAQQRQHRGVDVERAQRRQVDDGPGQDVPVRHHHAQVGGERAHLVEERVAARPLGLQHRQPLGQRHRLDRRRVEARPRPAARPVGLRDDAHHVEPLAEQGAQRGDGEVGGAPEEDAHRRGA
jgi:hypothetical protein